MTPRASEYGSVKKEAPDLLSKYRSVLTVLDSNHWFTHYALSSPPFSLNGRHGGGLNVCVFVCDTHDVCLRARARAPTWIYVDVFANNYV